MVPTLSLLSGSALFSHIAPERNLWTLGVLRTTRFGALAARTPPGREGSTWACRNQVTKCNNPFSLLLQPQQTLTNAPLEATSALERLETHDPQISSVRLHAVVFLAFRVEREDLSLLWCKDLTQVAARLHGQPTLCLGATICVGNWHQALAHNIQIPALRKDGL